MTYQSTLTLKNHGTARAMAFFAALLANGSAFAGPKIVVLPGDTTELNGTTETTANADFGNVDPFTIETFSAGNECLQIFVTFQGADLEATLVAPDGRTWRDDDSGGALQPRINAITTKQGWHILRLSHFSGAAVNADFTARITRSSNLSTCNPVTPPASS